MPDILVRIKRAVLAGRYAFSEKALWEMDADFLVAPLPRCNASVGRSAPEGTANGIRRRV